MYHIKQFPDHLLYIVHNNGSKAWSRGFLTISQANRTLRLFGE